MSKTELTRAIEKALIKKYKDKKNCVFANEVWIGTYDKWVDFAVYKPYNLSCIEIKVSKSDFKSKNGHNFFGRYNYYIVPKKLYEDIKDLIPDIIGCMIYNEETNKITTKIKSVDSGEYRKEWNNIIVTMINKMLSNKQEKYE